MIQIILVIIIYLFLKRYFEKNGDNFFAQYIPHDAIKCKNEFRDYDGNPHYRKYNSKDWIDLASVNNIKKESPQRPTGLGSEAHCYEKTNNKLMDHPLTGSFRGSYHSLGYGIIRHKSRNINDHLQRQKEIDISTPKFNYMYNHDNDYLLLYKSRSTYANPSNFDFGY